MAHSRILLTGFMPFDGRGDNPSQIIVEKLRREYDDSRLVAETLRTEFIAAGRRIRELIGEHRPDVCICLGLSERSDAILLERLAVNRMNARIPDNAGYQPADLPIVAGGPASYASTLPLERIADELERLGIPHRFSDSAGEFVCNHVFYSAIDEILRLGLGTRCGFMHVPWAHELGSAPGAMPLETLVRAAKVCMEVADADSELRSGDAHREIGVPPMPVAE